jgi:hypothetical protein
MLLNEVQKLGQQNRALATQLAELRAHQIEDRAAHAQELRTMQARFEQRLSALLT